MIPDDPASADNPPTLLARLQTIMGDLDLLSRDIASALPFASPAVSGRASEDDLRRLAQGLLWQRAIFSETFGSTEFVNPASNIMLFLYASGIGAAPPAGACCQAAGVPRTTALRWIGVLEQKELVLSTADPADGRRTFVALTDAGRAKMRRCLTAISEAPEGGPLMM